MAHQLDFHVTLWSDDSDALLAFEQALATVPEAPAGWECVRLARLLDDLFHKVSKAEVHSTDINWDDEVPLVGAAAEFEEEEDPLEKADRLSLPTFEDMQRLLQQDWGEFDKAEAERIRNLLHNADKQTDWGKTLRDYGEYL